MIKYYKINYNKQNEAKSKKVDKNLIHQHSTLSLMSKQNTTKRFCKLKDFHLGIMMRLIYFIFNPKIENLNL